MKNKNVYTFFCPSVIKKYEKLFIICGYMAYLHNALTNVVSYCFLSVNTVGAVRCVRTINSVKVIVEAYVSCNDAYSCAIPRAIVEVVCKYFKSLRVVIA